MTTTIGLISDIHADLDALEHALILLKDKQVDRILCCGDLVDRGFDGDEVIERIDEANIPCVMGNHDEDMLMGDRAFLLRERWELVSDASMAKLKQFPYKRPYTVEGVDILLAHGSPNFNTDYLFPDMTLKEYQRVLKAAKASVLMVGHTHMPMCIEVKGQGWIVNPGSVCLHERRDTGSCGILTLPEVSFTVYSSYSGSPIEISRRILEP